MVLRDSGVSQDDVKGEGEIKARMACYKVLRECELITNPWETVVLVG